MEPYLYPFPVQIHSFLCTSSLYLIAACDGDGCISEWVRTRQAEFNRRETWESVRFGESQVQEHRVGTKINGAMENHDGMLKSWGSGTGSAGKTADQGGVGNVPVLEFGNRINWSHLLVAFRPTIAVPRSFSYLRNVRPRSRRLKGRKDSMLETSPGSLTFRVGGGAFPRGMVRRIYLWIYHQVKSQC
jgi:hypothetical protein